MKLSEIYSKRIERRINPVAVVSELEQESVKQDIEEYVFTKQIYDYMYTVINGIINEQHGRTGIWINGYYGSGKSHFLKYIFYCLNKKNQQTAIAHFKDSLRSEKSDVVLGLTVSDALLNDLSNKLEKTQVDTIMFNIDAVSGDINHKEVITKLFLNQLNKSQGYNGSYIALAKLERQLDKVGKFADFKKAIKDKFKEDWDKKSGDIAEGYLSDVLAIAKKLIGIDENSFSASIDRALSGRDELSVENLVVELKEFLADKPASYKLVYLVDEVSQYIGTNLNLLLNLQSIVEEVGATCGSKVWVVCTAQQEIQEVISSTGQNHTDFGKIMARFETKISLQSQDYADIIKKRILEKNSAGTAELSSFFDNNKNIIVNQFLELNNLLQNFKSKEDFVETYPFVPYQFSLISYVFDSFSNQGFVTQGVKNTERSLLGITHYTAKNTKDESTGFIVPFDAFFNTQLTQSLTNFATNKLELAYNADSKLKGKFEHRVINALFMIANLSEKYQKIFPASLDNLVYILMNKVDEDKLELQQKVYAVIDALQEAAVIIKTDNNTFRFLGDDEIIVINEIQHTKVTTDAFLDSFYKDVLEHIIDPNRKVSFDGNNYDAQIAVDEKEISTKGDFKILFAVTDTNEIPQMLLQAKTNDLVVCLNHSIQDIRKDFTEYVQIVSYIRNNSDTSNKQRSETLQNFRQQADVKLNEIRKRVEEKFLQTSFISNGSIVNPQAITGANAKTKYFNALTSHLAQVYRKKSLANTYAQAEDNFRKKARSIQLSSDDSLTEAEREVDQTLNMMNQNPVLSDVVNKFKVPPYGWKDIATLDVLLQLARKNKRKFHLLSEPLDLKEYAEKALNNRDRQKIEVLPEDVIDRSTLYKVVQSTNNAFNQTVLDSSESDANILFKKLTEFLNKKTDESDTLVINNSGLPFIKHLQAYHASVKKLSVRRDKTVLFTEVISEESNLKSISDNYKVTKEFIEEQISDYLKFKSFTDENGGNFSSLDDADKLKGDKLSDYFHSDDKPYEKFIEVKKIQKELSKSINDLVKQLKEQAMEAYNNAFDRLETKQKELGLDESILPDRGYRIDKIKRLNSVPELRLNIPAAKEFEMEYIQKIHAAKAKLDEAKGKVSKQMSFVSIVNDDGGSYVEIKSVEELDLFIKKFRDKVLAELNNNKIVGIKK